MRLCSFVGCVSDLSFITLTGLTKPAAQEQIPSHGSDTWVVITSWLPSSADLLKRGLAFVYAGTKLMLLQLDVQVSESCSISDFLNFEVMLLLSDEVAELAKPIIPRVKRSVVFADKGAHCGQRCIAGVALRLSESMREQPVKRRDIFHLYRRLRHYTGGRLLQHFNEDEFVASRDESVWGLALAKPIHDLPCFSQASGQPVKSLSLETRQKPSTLPP